MFQPETYVAVLSLMLVSMFCWGSWANTMKLCPGYRFQLFYWDYIAGLILGALVLGLTFGSAGHTGHSFVQDVTSAGSLQIGYAVLSGVLFNIANVLLVAAIEIAGLAVAFPVGIGLALVVGAVSNYLLAPSRNPLILFLGIGLVAAAIVLDAVAYRMRETVRRSPGTRGIVLSLIAGLLMGSFYPFVTKAMTGPTGVGPYAVGLFFTFGVLLCAIPFNYLLMRKPIDGSEPVTFSGFGSAPAKWHLWGVLGGFIWCTGAIANFVASRAHVVGPAVSYSIGQGATMVSAIWGVFIWREFKAAPHRAKMLLACMFVFFLLGLSAIALAPVI